MRGWFGNKLKHSNAAKEGWRKRKARGEGSSSATVREFCESKKFGNRQLYLNIILNVSPKSSGVVSIPVTDDDLRTLYDFKKVQGMGYLKFKTGNTKLKMAELIFNLLGEYLKDAGISLKSFAQ